MHNITFKILVVEDDADDRYILDEAFTIIEYQAEIKKFTDGEHLLEYLAKIEQSQYPSLIVLDNWLPKLDALSMLLLLKQGPLYKNIPVIVYGTEISPQRKNKLLSMGAYACVKKGTAMWEIIDLARILKDVAESTPPNKNLVS
jgi:CheY-like chemotaxis protein